MADNVTANPGSGGASFRSTDIAGVHSPHSKMEWGGTGVANQIADSAGNRLPTKIGEIPAGAAADGHSATLGATTDAEAAGNGSVVALLKRLRTLLGAVALDTTSVAIRDRLPSALVSGRLDVNVGNTAAVSGTVTANAGTGFAPVLTDGAAAGTQGLHALGTDGTNAQILSTNASGHVNIADGGNVISVDDNSGSLTVDGNVGITGAVTVNATIGANDLLKAEDAAHASGDAGVMLLGVRDDSGGVLAGATGDYIPLSINASGHARVAAFGSVAHDGAAAGNPVQVAYRANANEPTAVQDGDVTWPWADRFGRTVVVDGHPSPEPPVTVNVTASGNTTVIAAPGASLSLYIQKGVISNRAATNRLVTLQDGAGGTARFRAEVAAEGGGVPFDFGAAGWKLTANTLLNANLDAAGDVDVNVTQFYIAA